MSRQIGKPRRRVKAWVNLRHRRGIDVVKAVDKTAEAIRRTHDDADAVVGTYRHGDVEVNAVGRCLTLGELVVCVKEEVGSAVACRDGKNTECFHFTAWVVSFEPSDPTQPLEEALGLFLTRRRRYFRGVFSLPELPMHLASEYFHRGVFDSVRRVIESRMYLADESFRERGFTIVPVDDVIGGARVRYDLYVFSVPHLVVFRARGCSIEYGELKHRADCFANDFFDVFVVEPQPNTKGK